MAGPLVNPRESVCRGGLWAGCRAVSSCCGWRLRPVRNVTTRRGRSTSGVLASLSGEGCVFRLSVGRGHLSGEGAQ